MKAPFGCSETLRRVIVDGKDPGEEARCAEGPVPDINPGADDEARYWAIDRIATFRLDEEVDPQRMVRCLGQKRREELTV